MPYSQVQIAEVIRVLSRRTKSVCPFCGSADLAVLPEIANIQLYTGVGYLYGSGDAALPSIVTLCKNCGNTQFFNANLLGVARILNLPSDENPFGTGGKVNG